MKRERFIFVYLLLMVAFLVVSSIQLIRAPLGDMTSAGHQQAFLVWGILGGSSLMGAVYSLLRVFDRKPTLKFGEVFYFDELQPEAKPSTGRKSGKGGRLRLVRRNMSRHVDRLLRPAMMVFVWFCATLFATALWKVWNTPRPWSGFTMIEVAFLATGSLLAVVVACGLGFEKRWAAILGWIFAFIQLLWFPVGLLSGILYFILLKRLIFSIGGVHILYKKSFVRLRKRKDNMASKRPVNKQLQAKFKQQDAA